MKILVSLSGGLDSAVLLALLKAENHEVHCVSFIYGSKHNAWENQAAMKIAEYYKTPLDFIDIRSVMVMFKSNLLIKGGKIPEGHYEDKSMKQTVVPSRNMLFLSIMSGIAESMNIPTIAIGVHAGDHFIYPDCRPDFITSMETSIRLASDNAVESLITPLLNINKQRIVKIGIGLEVPFELTRTCYTENELACGKCGSCVERLEAFKLNKFTDPIKYQNK